MKKAVIFAEIFSPNLGDGLIYESVMYLFSLNNIESVPVDISGRISWENNSKVTKVERKTGFRRLASQLMRHSRLLRRIYNALSWILVVRPRIKGEWEAAILSSDLVIIGGGQLLTDIDFSFPPRIFEVARLAKRHGKPLAFFGVGAGSSGWGFVARFLYSYALKHSDYISCRDYTSLRIIESCVPKSEVHVHPDPVFIYNRIKSISDLKYEQAIETIGFNFQSPNHFRSFVPELRYLTDEEYIQFWVSLIYAARIKGYNAVIFTNGDIIDYDYATTVHSILENLGCSVCLKPRPTCPNDLVESLKGMDAMISTRMHAGIVGFALNKKIVAVSWDRKVDSVWESLDMKENVVSSSVLFSKKPWAIFEELILRQDALHRIKLDNIYESLTLEVKKCCMKLGV